MTVYRLLKHKTIARWLRFHAILAGLLLYSFSVVLSQSTDDGWSQPHNLSQSGAASEPQIVALSDGTLVLWRDAIDGFAWTRTLGESWTPPRASEFPFATRAYYPDLAPNAPTPTFRPLLTAVGNIVHAVWRNDEGALYYSAAPADTFGDFAAWTPRQQVASAAAASALTADAQGVLHLTYVRPVDLEEAPAGLYYRRSLDGGQTWSEALLLYPSAYFRLLSPENANVQVATGNNNAVFVAVDDRAREQLLFVRSTDGGATWSPAAEIDRRQESDSSSANGPGHVRLAVAGDSVHLTWQAGHEGLICAQYHQWSQDVGQTWQPRQRILDTFSSCATDVQFLLSADTPLLLVNSGTGSYLLAWQNERWTDAQLQAPLQGFTDAQTFRQVEYTCGQDAMLQNGQLLVANCGQSATQDIWLLSRPLASWLEALASTPVWSRPAPVIQQAETASGETVPVDPITSPLLVAGTEGHFHLFWTQSPPGNSTIPVAPVANTIYYARWDGSRWSQPVAVVAASAQMAKNPTAVLTPQGRLLLLWSGGTAGEILYSSAAATHAHDASEWAEPQPLPAPHPATSAPNLLLAPNGVLYATYAVPLNEQRGIYLTRSEDGGETWSDPQQIFDAAAASWEMVDKPSLTATGPNQLHAVWHRRSLPQQVNTTTLYYSRSDDGGRSWATPVQAVNGTPQTGAVVWSQILGLGDRTVHRAWQEWDGTYLNLWHQFSTDSGATWSQAARLGTLGQASGAAALVHDVAQRVYALQVAAPVTGAALGSPQLQPWRWNAEEVSWVPDDTVALHTVALSNVASLTAAIDRSGQLLVVTSDQDARSRQPLMLFTGRRLALPEVSPTPVPTLRATPPPTPTPTPTSAPQPTATLEFPTAPDNNARLNILPTVGANSIAFGALVAVPPALFIVAFVVLLYLRAERRRH